jgi:hypothetical protein
VSGSLATAAAASGGPPDQVFFALAPILILAVAFDAYCLRDLSRARSVRHVPKWVWVIVILLSAPWGGLLYLFAGRDGGGTVLR